MLIFANEIQTNTKMKMKKSILAIACLAIVKIGGKPVLDVPSAMKQIPLPVVIFAGTVSVFAVPLSCQYGRYTTAQHSRPANKQDYTLRLNLKNEH